MPQKRRKDSKGIGGARRDRPGAATDRLSGMSFLYERAGFLLRRSHQISVSIFLESCADLDLTNAQFGILYTLRENPGVDQVAVAKMLGLDRSTISNVIERLAARGLILRAVAAGDRRRRNLTLTRQGRAVLSRAFILAAKAQERLLEPLMPPERSQLVSLLSRLVEAHAPHSRVPFEPAPITTGRSGVTRRTARPAKAGRKLTG